MRLRAATCAIGVVALAGYLLAQATSRLTGSLVDPTGAPVPAATIDLFLPAGSRPVLTANTTGEGLFAFTGVAPGTYDVVLTAQGFRKHSERGVVLTAGAETSMPAIRLEVGNITETVEVTDTTLSVQTTNAEIALHLTRSQ